MVGFGSNYPTHVRSRVASCPDTGSCGDTYLNSTSDNIYEMTGAVIGGPNEAGEYEDSRLNILGNGISVYYNAALVYNLSRLLPFSNENTEVLLESFCNGESDVSLEEEEE